MIYPLVGSLRVASLIPELMPASPELGVVITGLMASVLLGLIYITPISTLTMILAKRRDLSLSARKTLKIMILALAGSLLVLVAAEATSSPLLAMVGSSALVVFSLFLAAIPTSIVLGTRLIQAPDSTPQAMEGTPR